MTSPAVGPDDERPHPAGSELQWSESASFWIHDAGEGIAGSLRVSARPNEGMVDAGLHFWLPDGGFVAARHVRAESTNTDRLEAGDARFEVVEPLRCWRIVHDGPAHSLKSARDAGDREAWHRSRIERLIVDLEFEAAHGPIGYSESGEGMPSPREGFEQPGRWRGSIWVSGDEYAVHGHGVRDKSWGLRDWQAPSMWRRFSFAGEGIAASAVRIGRVAMPDVERGWILRGGVATTLAGVRVATSVDPGTHLQQTARLELLPAAGESLVADVEVLAVAPMRSARNRRETLICEGFARFTVAGETVHGIAEYLHQLDGAGAPIVPID